MRDFSSRSTKVWNFVLYCKLSLLDYENWPLWSYFYIQCSSVRRLRVNTTYKIFEARPLFSSKQIPDINLRWNPMFWKPPFSNYNSNLHSRRIKPRSRRIRKNGIIVVHGNWNHGEHCSSDYLARAFQTRLSRSDSSGRAKRYNGWNKISSPPRAFVV